MYALEAWHLLQEVTDLLAQLQDTTTVAVSTPGWTRFTRAWLGFSDWRLLLRVSVSLLVSIALASAIAFHPNGFRGARNAEDFERPRTLLMYAVVGALVAEIVVVSPPMALVVFGIGGLLRFRTDAGAASDTGRVILVTIVGIATGLGLFPYAFLATASGWLLIFLLERRPLYRIELEEDEDGGSIDELLGELRDRLEGAEYDMVNQSRYRMKGEAFLVVRGRGDQGDEAFDNLLYDYVEQRKCRVKWNVI